MSLISDSLGSKFSLYGEIGSKMGRAITGGSNSYSDFLQKELVDKSQLRGAQMEAVLSGLPLVGGIFKGLDNAQQMDDLYNNTNGKVYAYPGIQSSGLSSAGRDLGKVIGKIEPGTNDLFKHYSGTEDDTIESLHEKGILTYGDEL